MCERQEPLPLLLHEPGLFWFHWPTKGGNGLKKLLKAGERSGLLIQEAI